MIRPLDMRCPTCEAESGLRCSDPHFNTRMIVGYHDSRVDKAFEEVARDIAALRADIRDLKGRR